jgi:predicted dienelactone hydrolase
MKRLICLVLTCSVFFPASRAGETNAAAPAYKETQGPFEVQTVSYDWLDQKRDRNVPVKIYFPKSGAGPFPVIIFSHGLGGSREGYEYLGRHWASYGYVSVHVQHIGSDSAVWSQGRLDQMMQNLEKAAANLENITNRPLDVSFAIDQIEKMNREGPTLKARLDLNRIGVAGHSFGAFTTLAVAGEVFIAPGGREATFTDARVKAAIPMSAPVNRNWPGLNSGFNHINVPCFHMTGTLDSSPIGRTAPEDRRVPYDLSKGADKLLVIFEGGDHMVFSGRGRMRGGEKDDLFQRYILLGSTAFWDAYLKGDQTAKAWVTGDGFKTALGKDGRFEERLR